MSSPTRYHGTACKTCRRRGRRCTKELPKCKTCLDKPIECEGYVLRWAGLASRGKLAGKRTHSDEEPPPSTTTISSIPLTNIHLQARPEDILSEEGAEIVPQAGQDIGPETVNLLLSSQVAELASSIENSSEASNQLTWTLSPLELDVTASLNFDLDFDYMLRNEPDAPIVQEAFTAVDSPPPLTELTLARTRVLDPYGVPEELKFILNYHVLEVSPKLVVDNHSARNPYSSYILPLALQKPPLLYACAALAASHYSVRLMRHDFYVQCLRFRGKAMRRLQELLWSEQSAKDEGNLATVLMLTLCDMCVGGFSNFDAHFAAARRLIDLRGDNYTQDRFVEQYIAWLDIMSAASNTRQQLFYSTDVEELIGPSGEWSFDLFPCPPDQTKIIAKIVELYKSQIDPTNPSWETLQQAQVYKSMILSCPMHNERGDDWLHLTEAYRHAIALYIIRIFNFEEDEDEIAWHTQSIFYHAKSTPTATGWSDQLLWPLFHAALEFRDKRRREWLRQRAIEMQLSGGFRNVETAIAILEKVWRGETPRNYMNLLAEDGLGNMLVV